MTLGEKLLAARQEAGLSQRQLCGDVITRNMLSQIEHGTAKPSMDTLQYLAHKLGKPVSYFLEETSVLSPNQERMAQARLAFSAGDYATARKHLLFFQQPDPVLEWEWKYLSFAAALKAAEQALAQGKHRYAKQLLEDASAIGHNIPGLERQRLLLLGQVEGTDPMKIAAQLPSLDGELLLRAEAALMGNDASRAAALLWAAEDFQTPRWKLLWGRVLSAQKQYAAAAEYLGQVEESYPEICLPLLEICYRELGDFQNAYLYACKQR